MRYSSFIVQSETISNRLKSLKTQITAFEKVQTLTTYQVNKIKEIQKTALSKNNEFDKIVAKLFQTTPLPEELGKEENLTKVSSFQDEIGDLFMSIQSACVTLIPPAVTTDESLNDSGTSQNAPSGRPTTNIQLPRIQLGKFSGQPENWVAFKNLFENTIHNNESISNVEKMSYLLSCLEGEALSVVKSLPMTNANYFIAWENLNKRFHNNRLLIALHVNNLLDLPTSQNPSVKQLRHFSSVLNENIEALKALGQDVSTESLFLTAHLLRKFDVDFRQRFERHREDTKAPPRLEELTSFINSHCAQLEAANLSNVGLPQKSSNVTGAKFMPPHKASPSVRSGKTALLTASSSRFFCNFCSSSEHNIYSCKSFNKISVQDRFNFVKENSLCRNCLGNRHKTSECSSSRTCGICKKWHHTLLHFSDARSTTPNNVKNSTATPKANTSDQQASHLSIPSLNNPQTTYGSPPNSSNLIGLTDSKPFRPNDTQNTVLLATVLVSIKSQSGKNLVCRGILDSAAQSTFITEKCAQTLGLKRSYANQLSINGISAAQVKTKGLTHVSLTSLSGEILVQHHPVLILDKITHDLPRTKVSPEVRRKMKHLVLADPTFDTPAPIDILLGADLFSLSLKGQTISLGDNMPVAIETIFGYALFGQSPTLEDDKSCNGLVTLLTTNTELHSSLQKFWTLEEPPQSSKYMPTPEEEKCEAHFVSTHERNSEGRYVVGLPFSDEPHKLGSSYQSAVKVFYSLENKFRSNPSFKTLYVDFMRDYAETNHMTLCEAPPPKEVPHYFLQHHGVLKENKIRVVFNASAPTSSSLSLNSILFPGPKLHNNICDIILNFRKFPVVFSCDIKQMFRQVLVREQDQLFQLIVWREHESQPLQIYRLCTVTYGFTSSPYLANRVIQQLILDEGSQHPLAASALKDQIYVDDVLVGCNSLEDAKVLKEDVIQLLQKGGFELRKWSSNHPALLDDVPQDHRDSPIGFVSPEQPLHSVLGLKWLPNSDVFAYKVKLNKISTVPTKRTVLSSISQIYDPIGWLTPVTFWAKSFMQHLWTLGLGWDEPIGRDLTSSWQKFETELHMLEDLQIPRYIDLATASNIQLHGFSDGSEAGFSACVYLRVEDSDKNVFIHLLIAKSKVAPLKRVTLPRLELCGAHLLSKLLHYCKTLLSPHYHIDSVSAWCDSTITLSWIRTPSYRLKVFVANRVTEIQENVAPSLWYHISSPQNPADCASRGIEPGDLRFHPLWWSGPSWLKFTPDQWPISKIPTISEENLPETKSPSVATLTVTRQEPFDLLTRFSSWPTLIHVTAFVLRFISNLKSKTKMNGILGLEEINNATLLVCKLVQQEAFSDEISLLKKKQLCSLRIRRLSPLLDENEILRVGGRLNYSTLPQSTKNPILLPKNHPVVNSLIDYYHILYLHAGPTMVQSMLSNKFWILSARSVVRSRIFKCIRCFKCKPSTSIPTMGNLPKPRITPSRVFSVSGVDFAGPFMVKQSLLRRTQPTKVYLCIFICFSTKAIHCEVVTDLTSNAYIAALTRFISRRGVITDLYSDNGTNFTGAAEKLRRIFEDLMKNPSTSQFAEKYKIKFHFIPPHAPHHGGLWERAVRSAKHHLTRVIGQQVLTLEEFITLTTKVEAILNSRPITPLSADPSDLEALTPGHFIAGGPLMLPVEPTLEQIPVNRLSRWQMVQRFSQNVWSRWQKEYLHTLQERPKWTTPKKNVEVNDLVLVHEENAPPLQWKLARVTAVIPGLDDIVRVVKLKTSSGQLTRPVTKVSVLPSTQD